MDCKFCITKTSERDDFSSMLFASDEWDIYYECSLTKRITFYKDEHCPLKLKT